MLPQDVLSTSIMQSPIIGAKAKSVGLFLEDFEDGGIDIGDPSEGLMYQEWRGEFKGQKITLTGANGNTFDAVTVAVGDSLTSFSFSFDQNMRPVVAYMLNGRAVLFYFSTLVSDYVNEDQQVTMISPKVLLDDKRLLNINGSDVILAYIDSTIPSLCFRQQRDRYLDEYVLSTKLTNSAGRIFDSINAFGMGKNLRLQFVLY